MTTKDEAMITLPPHPWGHNGGPAWPSHASNHWFRGMTLRDWFAGQALAECFTGRAEQYWPLAARECYAMADAMLAARKDGGVE